MERKEIYKRVERIVDTNNTAKNLCTAITDFIVEISGNGGQIDAMEHKLILSINKSNYITKNNA